VRVYETASGMLYVEERVNRRSRRYTLGHRDKQRAESEARRRQAELVLGLAVVDDPTPTFDRVSAAYLATRTPRKKNANSRRNDERAEAMWTQVLGADKDVSTITEAEWLSFVDRRQSGEINARGEGVTPSKRRPVRARAVAADLEWLRTVLNWATKARDEKGRYFLRASPVRGYEIPKEANPRRPVASQDRYEAIREVSDQVTMEIRSGGKRHQVRSYLSELLDIVNGTGRRVSAVLDLHYEDLRLDEGPDGAIQWRADSDKMGKAWVAPINAQVRGALDRILRERPGIGRAYLFPSPRTARQPVSKDLASSWLKRAEKLAKVPKMEGSLWHAYRRKWATERKHLPDKDVAYAGGWKDLTVLKSAYQQVDEATLYRVVSEPAELREVQRG
jgi:site-specific recombinase XerD